MNKTQKKNTPPAMPENIRRFKPGTIRRLLSYLGAYRIQLILVVVCILISAGCFRCLRSVHSDADR